MRVVIALLLILFGLNCYSAQRVSESIPSYMLLNLDNNVVVDSHNEAQIRSIASITKLMSVLVVLRGNLDLDEVLTVVGKESSKHIRSGMKITRNHLIELALISSDNLATRTLAETFPGGYTAFLATMNQLAQELGMSNTRYSDTTGLLSDNKSSADDIKKLVLEVENWAVYKMAANVRSTLFSAMGLKKSVLIQGNNTNWYAGRLNIVAAKTGFTNSAGRCLTMLFVHNNTRYFLIVMGAKNSEHRRKIVDSLLDKII